MMKMLKKLNNPEYIQIFNPRIERWVKINRTIGKVVEIKDTEGPHPHIKKYITK